MTTTITALTVLSQNSYSELLVGPPATGDFTIVDTELMINSAVNMINLLAGTSMAKLTGSPGTTDIDDDEEPAFSLLMTIMLREAKKTSLSSSSNTSGSSGSNSSVSFPSGFGMSQGSSVSSAISAATAINSSGNSPLVDFFNQAIERLRALHPLAQASAFRLRFGVGQATS